MKLDYSDKLKNPRWQKKRLEILQRDKFECLACGNKENELHVHHITYEHGKDPWDYDDCNFITICDSCHNDFHRIISEGENNWINRQSKMANTPVSILLTVIIKVSLLYKKTNCINIIKEINGRMD